MRGKMVWFNEEKGHGYITTEEGERLYVSEDRASPRANAPKGRCAGLQVEFELTRTTARAEAMRVRSRRRQARRRAPGGGTEPAASAYAAGILTG